MAINSFREVLPVINALPDAVLVISQAQRRVIGANDVFFDMSGLNESDIVDVAWNNLPFVNKPVKQGLLHLIMKLESEHKYKEPFVFSYVAPGGISRNMSTTAKFFSVAEEKCILFNFKEVSSPEIFFAGANSEEWKTFLQISLEPYLEFRPSEPLCPSFDLEDRTAYLEFAGNCLRVKLANEAAVKMYKGEKGILVGESFASFFNKEEDAFRFLDMLSIVGQIRAETTVNAYNQSVQVEMNCTVRFNDDGSIAALYCGQRNLSGGPRYDAVIGGNPREMNFMFQQPFTGFAFLAPSAPIERPRAENVDEKLDEILKQILILKANDAMIDIYETEKSKFLLKPMANLFEEHKIARQVLKELFVIRTTSIKSFPPTGDENALGRVSVYTGMFNEADCLNGVLVATSKYHVDYNARHIIGQTMPLRKYSGVDLSSGNGYRRDAQRDKIAL